MTDVTAYYRERKAQEANYFSQCAKRCVELAALQASYRAACGEDTEEAIELQSARLYRLFAAEAWLEHFAQ